METKSMTVAEIDSIFHANVIDNTKVKIVENNMEFVRRVIDLIKCTFHLKKIDISMGNVHEPFGYNVHVDNLYLRVSSMGIHLQNDKVGYRQQSEQLVKDIVAYCNENMVRSEHNVKY